MIDKVHPQVITAWVSMKNIRDAHGLLFSLLHLSINQITKLTFYQIFQQAILYNAFLNTVVPTYNNSHDGVDSQSLNQSS